MTDAILTAIIAAGSALMGGTVAGAFALIAQRMTLRSTDQRAQLEADDRERTRFHDQRRALYADFLTAASDAAGSIQITVLARHRAETSETEQPAQVPTGQFGPDAPMRLTRSQALVAMISASPEVRQASEDLVNATFEFAHVKPGSDPKDLTPAFWAALQKHRTACSRFLDAANAELNASPTSTLAPRRPSEPS